MHVSRLLTGDMTLGDLVQAAAASWQVHAALNWLADNALSLANWSASARRVGALDLAFQELDNQASQDRRDAPDCVKGKSNRLEAQAQRRAPME